MNHFTHHTFTFWSLADQKECLKSTVFCCSHYENDSTLHAIDQKFPTTVIFKSNRLQLKIVCQRSFKARANYWCNLSITVLVQIIWNDDSSSQNWYSFYLKTRLIRAINFNNVYCFKYITLTNKERSTSTGKKYLRVHLYF